LPSYRIVFTPSGKRGSFDNETSILEAARKLGVDLDSVCGGRGICGRCQIDVAEGNFAKHAMSSGADHASAWNAVEQRYADKRSALAPGRRLGCQAKICGDLVVDVPPESQVHRQVVRKRAETHQIDIDPVVRLHYVEVAEPDMHDPSSDFRRLQSALAAQWGVEDAQAGLPVLVGLQKTLRAGGWRVTVALRKGREIVSVAPGFSDRAFGVALDIGSTTIAAHLTHLETGEVVASRGAMNPQIRFGEDLMSRVSHVMMNPGGEAELTRSARASVDALIGEAATEAQVARGEILEMTVVGNPIMHHLFLGLDPTELGGAPFALTIDGAFEARARELQLDIAPGAYVYALPCIAGHVGADTSGVALAEAPYLSDELTLIADIGTNAEILFGNRDGLTACSSPTGPAFEGAQISCGQRAAPGAIERVRIDRETLEPRFKVIGSDLWSDEPGFAAAAATLGVTGVCGSGIIEAIAEMYLSGIISQDGVIDGTLAAKTPRIETVGRSFAYASRRRAGAAHLPDGCARDPTGEIRAPCRRETADRAARRGTAEARHAGWRVRRPHRSALCDGARPDPRLRPRPCRQWRQRGGHGREDRAAQPRRPRRDRGHRAPDREGRDRDRTEFSRPFRRGDGVPARERPVRESGAGDQTTRATRGWGAEAAAQIARRVSPHQAASR
jgi:uncharacterized 2Fe-2S/4Fe-4S cluster protein (DUF4445 family)